MIYRQSFSDLSRNGVMDLFFFSDMELETVCCWPPCQQHPLLRFWGIMSPLRPTRAISTQGGYYLGNSR